MQDWVVSELSDVDFGDSRINSRFTKIVDSFSSKPESSISSTGGWSEVIGSYRFFDNDKVTPDKILSPHLSSTIMRIKKESTVLLLQDTSEINYNNHSKIPGLGPLTTTTQQGFHIHPVLAVTPSNLCLGTIYNKSWSRKSLGSRKKTSQPIEEKESYCWIEGYEASKKISLLCPNTHFIVIGDRESDIYDLFAAKQDSGVDWLVRSRYDRTINDKQKTKIKKKLDSSSALGNITFEIPATKERSKRKIVQEVKAIRVTLKPPNKKKQAVDVTAILCKEINPPANEQPITWFLLTSLIIDKNLNVDTIISYYLSRWQIEIFFKTLKSGCNIEKLQLKSYDRILRCISLYMIIAWRIMYMTSIAKQHPELPCSVVFTESEWKAIYVFLNKDKPPNEPPNISKMVNSIAILGGYLDRKNDSPPGVKTIWKGLERARDIVQAYEMFYEKNRCV